MPRDPVRPLLELFGEEQSCYTGLLDVARRQNAALRRRSLREVPALIRDKDRLLTRLADVEARLRPTKDRWTSFARTLDDADRQLVDWALSTNEELLGELIAAERSGEALLAAA